jgi:hypothetical protein
MNYGATWKGKKEPGDPCQFLDKFAQSEISVKLGGPPRKLNPTYVQCRKQQGIRVYYERDPLNRFGPSKLVEEPYASPTIRKGPRPVAETSYDSEVGVTTPMPEPKWTFLEEVLWGEGIPTWVWVAGGLGLGLYLGRK